MEPSSSNSSSPPPPAPSSYEIATGKRARCISGSQLPRRTLQISPTPPLTLLEDLATIHHLLSQDQAEPQLLAEQAAIETFSSLMWGHMTWQSYITAARSFGRPALHLKDITDLDKMPYGANCIYRNKGLELLADVVEVAKGVDAELGVVLESCRGDWMVRFRRHSHV